MKRFAAWLLAALMLVQLLPCVSLEALAQDGEDAAAQSDWTEVFSTPVSVAGYHTVTFAAEGAEIPAVFVADGASVGSLPSAPQVEGKTFVGWYVDNAVFTADTPVTADLTVRAV